MPAPNHSIFTGWMLFLMLNQHFQSTVGVGLLTTASSLKDVNITQHIVAIYPQSLAGCKSKPTVNGKNSSCMCVSLCTTVIHSTAQNSSNNLSS